MTDESVLVRPTAAQKPEPCSLVRSATGADRTPSQHWHPAIWERACMVLDAFPSFVPCIVAIWTTGCSLPRVLSRYHHLTDRLLHPPSAAPSFPPPPHRCDDDKHHCIKQRSFVACGSTTILPSPIAQVVCVSLRCLSICVAYQMPRSDMAVVKANKRMARYHLIMHAHVHSRESAGLIDLMRYFQKKTLDVQEGKVQAQTNV